MKKYVILLLFALNIYTLYAQKKCNAVSIYFESNKHTLTEENISEVRRVLSAASLFKISGVVIEGRTDTTGSEKANLMLSQKRIDATMRTLKPLLNKSIPIETKNYGESNPISLTDLNKNRVVKITFLLDTLINLAKQGEGEILLNTKLLGNIDSCNFMVWITPYIYKQYNYIYSSTIPLDKNTGTAYEVRMFNSCFSVYIFPDSFYNTTTHIGRFVPPIDLWYCSDFDSLNFKYMTDRIKYDSISKNYYLIVDCSTPGGACCAGAKESCRSYTFVPEETMTHVTTVPYINGDYEPDTIFVEDERVWQNWGCASSLKMPLDTTPYVYSVAMFDSAYYYLKGKITQYRRTDTTTFEFLEEKYKAYNKTQIYQLQRKDYTSFASPTSRPLFIKAKPGYVPGYYLKHSDVFIPFEHIRKTKYKGYIIDFPTQFGLLQEEKEKLLVGSEIKTKLKTKKTKSNLKIEPLNESR